MRIHIQQVIEQLEIDYPIKVLYACESGSRAWGIPSKDSDYDVRFIYIHDKDWYLSIDQNRDVIEIPGRDSISIPINKLLDLSGWELSKALRLFRKSNPSLLEWLRSSIVYYQSYSAIERIRSIEESVFSPKICLNHYLNMAKGNFRECLKGQDVIIKKYINVLRPFLAAKWIEKYYTIPPVNFHTLLEDIILSGEHKEIINGLLNQKVAGEKLYLEPRIELINQYLDKEIGNLDLFTKSLNSEVPNSTSQLNILFREVLEEAWK